MYESHCYGCGDTHYHNEELENCPECGKSFDSTYRKVITPDGPGFYYNQVCDDCMIMMTVRKKKENCIYCGKEMKIFSELHACGPGTGLLRQLLYPLRDLLP